MLEIVICEIFRVFKLFSEKKVKKMIQTKKITKVNMWQGKTI